MTRGNLTEGNGMGTIPAERLNTITCADALEFTKSLPDASVDLILTDPPYNLLEGGIQWDKTLDLAAFWSEVERVITPTGVIAIFGAMPFAAKLVMSNLKLFRYEWVIIKNIATDFLNANHRPLRAHENVYIFSKGKTVGGANHGADLAAYYPQMTAGEPYINFNRTAGRYVGYNMSERIPTINDGERYPQTVLYSFVQSDAKVHPTQKDVEICRYLIRTYTDKGAIVLDPFCGSGTTALAAFIEKRQYICADISPAYVDIARDRLRQPFEPRRVKANNDLSGLPLFQDLTAS